MEDLFKTIQESLDELEQKYDDLVYKNEEFSKENRELESKIEDAISDYKEYKIGAMDTIYIKLHNGNLAIQQEVEKFINYLKANY